MLDNLKIAGEHRFFIEGPAGNIEGILSVPEGQNFSYLVLLGHPHSLQGGTMNNKVVTTVARTFKDLNLPSLRFNFRGVGESGGVYDAGIGESEDMLFLAESFQKKFPHLQFMFAGFSFGSYVAYRAASQFPNDLLITIAPPVHHYDYTEFEKIPLPWIVVQGDEDEVTPPNLVEKFIEQVSAPLTLLTFKETGHFFHGKLIELKTRLKESICKEAALYDSN